MKLQKNVTIAARRKPVRRVLKQSLIGARLPRRAARRFNSAAPGH
jgi:hypothetical protein